MEKLPTNQEILLLPDSHFFQRDWCERENGNNSKKLSQKETLINLCWNGMLKEMIPEIYQTGTGKKALTLWEVNGSGNLLDLRYGDFNQDMNDEWSLNPYIFLMFAEMS